MLRSRRRRRLEASGAGRLLATTLLALVLALAGPAAADEADDLFYAGFQAFRAGEWREAADKIEAGLAIREDATARGYLEVVQARLAARPAPPVSGRWTSDAAGDCALSYNEYQADGDLLVVKLYDAGELTHWMKYAILAYEGDELRLRFDQLAPASPAFEKVYGTILTATLAPDSFTWRQPDGSTETHHRCPDPE